MLIVTPALLRLAQATVADSAVLRILIRQIQGSSAALRDAAIGTLGATPGAHAVARHVAYL
jgi:hypothetical protein